MARKMTVHLFKVEAHQNAMALDVALPLIAAEDLEARVKDVSGNRVRIEQITPPKSIGNESPYWLLNFTKFRFENCPGKVGLNTPIEGFDIGKDEGFGEETAAIYDPKSKFMIIQYHHSGVRASAIESYLSNYFHDSDQVTGYELKVKLDPTAEAKLAKKKFITKVKLKIAPAQITKEFHDQNLSLGQVLDIGSNTKSKDVELILAADRGENLSDKFIMPLITFLKNLRQFDLDNDSAAMTKFEVCGRNEKEDRADAINMLAPKLKLVIDGLTVGGDKRYTIRSRWDGLLRAATGWKDYLK